MALQKDILKASLFAGLYKIFLQQSNKASSGDENESPQVVITQVATDMATVISEAVDIYVKGGDIIVGPDNVQVTSTAPGTVAAVLPLQPAKIK